MVDPYLRSKQNRKRLLAASTLQVLEASFSACQQLWEITPEATSSKVVPEYLEATGPTGGISLFPTSSGEFKIVVLSISIRINVVLIKIQILRLPPDLLNQSLGVGPRHLHFNQTFCQFLLLIKSESHYSEVWIQSVVCYQIYPRGSVLFSPCRD